MQLTKQDLRSPDAFISNVGKLTEFGFKHRIWILSSFGILLLIGLVWAGMGIYNGNKENQAQSALFQAEKMLKTDDAAAIPALKDVIVKFPGTQASVLASIDVARLLYKTQKYDDVMTLLTPMVPQAKHPVTQGLLLNYLALASEAKGDCNKAIEYWQKIGENPQLTFLHGSSDLKMGLCYEKLNQLDKAEQSYKKAESLTTNPEASRTAKKYLRLLKRPAA